MCKILQVHECCNIHLLMFSLRSLCVVVAAHHVELESKGAGLAPVLQSLQHQPICVLAFL